MVLDFPYSTDYTEEYLQNISIIDFHLKNKYGQLPMYYNNNTDISNSIQAVLFLNKYKYDGLYATTKLVYNPIWNVEGTETTTTTHGATETSNTYADRIVEDKKADKTKNEKYSEYPYDTKTKTAKNETDSTENGYTDTQTEKGRTDTTNTTEHVDTTVLDRRGNIGVTSTQNLIGQERDCVNFVFWDIVICDVVKEITIPYYDGECYDYNSNIGEATDNKYGESFEREWL